MKRLLLLVLLLFATCLNYAQVVTQAIDLTASPNSQVTIKGLDRAGIACKETDLNQQCVVFNIKINPNADILNFEVVNPAPSGAAANYRLNCEDTLRRLGPPICVLGQSTLSISFCKKGNDNAQYVFTTSQLVKASDDLTLRVGCSGSMSVTGLTPASTVWTSIYPGIRGQYDSFLAPATGSLSTTVTPQSTAPVNGYIDYVVSGNVAATSCTNYPRTDTVRVYVVPTFEVTTTPGSPTLCSNNTNGIVLSAAASGGRAPYTYKWSNGQTTSSITVSSPGDYTVTVSDNVPNCAPITKTVTVTSVAAPAAPAFSAQTICYNKQAVLSPPSVPGTYSYYDVPSGGTALFSGTETQPYTTPALTGNKTYYIEYTSACTSPRTAVPITVEPRIDPAFTYPNGGTYCTAATNPTPTLNGGVTGTFTANSVSLAIDPSTGKIDLINSLSGTYTVTFITSGTCAYTSTATITITDSPNANFEYPNSPYCQNDPNPTPSFTNGGSSGTFTAAPVGLVFVNNSTGEIDLRNSSPGTYTVTNTISTGTCGTVGATAEIIINAVATVNAGPDQTVCSGSAVQLDGSYGGGANGITWSAPVGTGTFSDTSSEKATFTPAAGISSVTLTLTTNDPDGAGPCAIQSDQLNIIINPTPSITSASNDILCNNTPNSYTITSDVGGTSYKWSRPAVTGISNPQLLNQSGNTISETLVNSLTVPLEVKYLITPQTASCTGATFEYKVIVNPTPHITSSPKDSVCSYNSLNYTITSNVPAAVFKWTRLDATNISPSSQGEKTGNLINETFVNSSASPIDVTYLITPYYGNCQGIPFTYTAVVKPTPWVNSNSFDIICNNQEINYAITSNIAGTTFSWSRDAIAGISNVAKTFPKSSIINETLNNTTSSPIDVVYKIIPYLNGCAGEVFEYTVTVNPTIAITNTFLSQTICSEATSTEIALTASVTGTTFSWTASGPGSLSGFIASGTGNIPAQTITNSGTTAENVTYTITPSYNGCPGAPVIYTITVNPKTAITNTVLSQTICSGTASTEVALSASVTGTTFTWSASAPATLTGFTASGTGNIPTQTIMNSGTTAENITYTITPSYNGCPGTPVTYTITVNPKTAITNTVLSQTICSGTASTEVALSASVTGTTYSWTASAPATLTGFTASGTANIPALTITNSGTTAENVTYTITPSYNDCPGTPVTYTITVNPKTAITNTVLSQTICSEATSTELALTASVTGTTYSWTASAPANLSGFTASGTGNIPVQTITNSGTTTEIVTYTITPSYNGCPGAPLNYTITVNPKTAITNTVLSQTICSGTASTEVALSASVTGTIFTWSASAPATLTGFTASGTGNIPTQTISNSGTTAENVTYTITPSYNGCPGAPVIYTITVNPVPSPPTITGTTTVCSGDATSLRAAAASGTFQWYDVNGNQVSTSAGFVTPALTQTTTYFVENTVNNCTSPRRAITVTVNPIPQKPEIKTSTPMCEGNDLQLRTSALYANAEYIWTGPNNFSSSQQNPVISNATAAASGNYTLTIKVDGCLSETETTNVVIGAIPQITKVNADTICIKTSGRLEAFGPAGNYTWYNTSSGGSPIGTGNVFNTPLLDSTTTYYVEISSSTGCRGTRVPVAALVLYPENPAFKYPTGTYCITGPANPKPDIYAKGGGSFSVNNPSLKFVSTTTGEINLAETVPGRYLITFTANNSCAYISTAELNITDKPSAKFVYINAGQFCQIDANPTPSFPDGGSAGVFTADKAGLVFINNTTGEINLRASQPGSYILKNTITGGGCLPDSAFYPVRIYRAPEVEAGSDITICSTERVTLNGSFAGSATGVVWSAPSGTFSNVNDPHAVYTPASGTSSATLRLTTFDPTGPCSAVSDTLTVYVKQTPIITSSALDSVCNDHTLNYRNTSTVPDAIITWSRDPVAGVFSDEVTDRVGEVINETLINTTNTVQRVVYRIKAANQSCESATSTYTVFVKPSAIINNTNLAQVTCSGSKTQAVTWQGSASGTTFTWSATAPSSLTGYLVNGTGGLPEQTISNSGSEPANVIYTVTPYFNGCAGSPLNYVIIINPIPAAPTISSNSPVCAGSSIQLNAQTPYTNAEYIWTGPDNFSSNLRNPVISNVSAISGGEYHLMIKVNGCVSPVSTVAIQIESSPAAPSVTPVSICINTSARLEANGPIGTYNWYATASGGSSIATGKIFNTPLLDSTRTYYVNVTSAAGCVGPRQAVTATVLYPENPAFKYSSGTYCRTAGFHPIPVITGNSGGTFSSSAGLKIVNAGTGEIDPATSIPGTYRVKFVANVSCQYVSFADITITDDPKAAFNYPADNYCQKDINPFPVFPAGNSGGVFSVDKPGLVFVNPSTGEINLSRSAPGTYIITNTISGGGCQTVTATFDLTIYEAPVVDAGTVLPLCPNEKATLHGKISGGATQGIWSAPSGSFSNPNDLNAVYTPAPGLSSVLLTLTSVEPAGPCTSITDTVRVKINPVLVITSSSSDSICNNQYLNYRITNTAPDAIIRWSRSKVSGIQNEAVTDGEGNFINEILINTTNSVQRVEYNITASNNCEARTHNYIVYVKPTTRITNTNLTQEICSGSETERITFNASIPGTNYSWIATAPDYVTGYSSSGQNIITAQIINNNGTAPASVIYTVTPYYKGCPGIPVFYTVIVKPKPQVSGVNTSVICSNEPQAYTIESPVAGTTFRWRRTFVNGISNPPSTGSGLKITEALVNTTSSPIAVRYFITPYYDGCVGQDFIYTVTVKATPVINVSSLTKEICSGETLSEIPLESNINGTSFSWTATTTGSLNNIQTFGSGNIPGQTIINNGSSVATITYKINYSYQGCPGAEAIYVVKVKPAIQTPELASNSPICKGVTLQLSAGNLANATYYWTGPDNFQSNLQNPSIPAAQARNGGTYSLFVMVNGCASPVKQIAVSVNEDPISPVASSNSPTCANSTIILKATHFEGAIYSWTGPNNFTSNKEQPEIPNAAPAMAGRYHVTITAPGCSSTGASFVDVNIKPTPVPPAVINQRQICSGETLVLSANGSPGGTYKWTGPNNFASTLQSPSIENIGSLQAGEYRVTITVDGCTSNPASTFVQVNQTAIAFAGSNRTVCASDSIVTLTGTLLGPASGGVWKSTGTGKFDPDNKNLVTNYRLSKDDIRAGQVDLYLDPVSLSSVCPPKPAYITLNIAPTPTVSAGEDQIVCSNIATVKLSGKVEVAASGLWTSSGTGKFVPSSSDLNTSYILSQRDILAGNIVLNLTSESTASCKAVSDKMNIKVITAPKVDAGRIVYVFKDEFTTLQPAVSGEELKYKWFPNDFMDDNSSKNPRVQGVEDRTYQLTVTGKGGCLETDEVQVIVLEPVNPPNTFTPNGDSKNDYWNIPQLAKYPEVKVNIFNRYGTKIFTANNYNTPWDGNYEGKPVPVGVYYYVIDIGIFNKKLSGYITVLR